MHTSVMSAVSVLFHLFLRRNHLLAKI